MERFYFLYINGQQLGPLSLVQARQQPITAATLVWFEGLSGWVAAETLDEFKDLTSAGSGSIPIAQSPPILQTLVGESPQVGASGANSGTIPGWSSNHALAQEINKYHQFTVAFFLCFIAALITTGFLAFIAADSDGWEGAAIVGLIGGAITLAFVILYLVFFCKFHYRCWVVANARTGNTEVSPGQAVGLLFIPLFNIYWYFRSYGFLSQLLAKAIQPLDYDPTYRPNTSTAQAMCVLKVCGVIPYLGALAAFVNIILWFIVIGENRKASTHLLRDLGS